MTDAAEFYRSRSPMLARDFRVSFERALLDATESPEQFPLYFARAGARRVKLERFPYHLVFLLEPDAIYVIALAHERREPMYWLRRLGF